MTPFTITEVAHKIRTATTAGEVQANIRLLEELGTDVSILPPSFIPSWYEYGYNSADNMSMALTNWFELRLENGLPCDVSAAFGKSLKDNAHAQ